MLDRTPVNDMQMAYKHDIVGDNDDQPVVSANKDAISAIYAFG